MKKKVMIRCRTICMVDKKVCLLKIIHMFGITPPIIENKMETTYFQNKEDEILSHALQYIDRYRVATFMCEHRDLTC